MPLRQHSARAGRDRLEVLTALIGAPSSDPLFRADIIKIPAGHPVYRWNCLARDCERATMGHGDLCSAHEMQWRKHRDEGGTRAGFLQAAAPAGPGEGTEEQPVPTGHSIRHRACNCLCAVLSGAAGDTKARMTAVMAVRRVRAQPWCRLGAAGAGARFRTLTMHKRTRNGSGL